MHRPVGQLQLQNTKHKNTKVQIHFTLYCRFQCKLYLQQGIETPDSDTKLCFHKFATLCLFKKYKSVDALWLLYCGPATGSGFWQIQNTEIHKLHKYTLFEVEISVAVHCVSGQVLCPEIAPGKGSTIPTSNTSSLVQNTSNSLSFLSPMFFDKISEQEIHQFVSFRAILKISLDDLHFAAILSLSNEKLFQLCHPSILHSLALPVLPQLNISASNMRSIALLRFQPELQIQLWAGVFFATLDKSFFWLILIELSVLFKVGIFLRKVFQLFKYNTSKSNIQI